MVRDKKSGGALGPKLTHLLMGILAPAGVLLVLCLAAERLLPPMAIGMALYAAALLTAANLAGGLTYGRMSGWSKWGLAGSAVLHVTVLLMLSWGLGIWGVVTAVG